MKDKKIRSVLLDALEEEIPSSQIQLWPAVKADLVAGKHNLDKQGKKMSTTRRKHIPGLALSIVTVLTLFAVILVSPQGRTFAQNIWHFFTRAESTTFQLGPSQIVTSERELSSPTAAPPMPLISVDEADEMVDFEVAELPFVPDGFNYQGARLYGNTISIEYEAQGGGGSLVIQQSREGYYQSDWDRVPEEAIVPVKIGEEKGEFTRGTFVVYAGETSATWNPDAPIMRLRWSENDIWFEMTKFGNTEAIGYLDQTNLIRLAESLTQ